MTDTTSITTVHGSAPTGPNAVDRFCGAITAAAIDRTDLFTDDAVLEATVPNWKFTARGAAAVRSELGGWYADPGRFDTLRRTPLPDGELVEFDLSWEEQGVTYACRQVHVLRLRDDRIAEDAVWCGGSWSPELVADMSAAQVAADGAPG
jgi:hypothetical protein